MKKEDTMKEDTKECPYCLKHENGKRVCSAVYRIEDCIEEDYTKCPIHEVAHLNEGISHLCIDFSKRCKDLEARCAELEQENKELRFLQYTKKEINRYLEICDICDGSESCSDCPNKNCADFCKELRSKLE